MSSYLYFLFFTLAIVWRSTHANDDEEIKVFKNFGENLFNELNQFSSFPDKDSEAINVQNKLEPVVFSRRRRSFPDNPGEQQAGEFSDQTNLDGIQNNPNDAFPDSSSDREGPKPETNALISEQMNKSSDPNKIAVGQSETVQKPESSLNSVAGQRPEMNLPVETQGNALGQQQKQPSIKTESNMAVLEPIQSPIVNGLQQPAQVQNNGLQQSLPAQGNAVQELVPAQNVGQQQLVPAQNVGQQRPVLVQNVGQQQPVAAQNVGQQRPVVAQNVGQQRPVVAQNVGQQQPVVAQNVGQQRPVVAQNVGQQRPVVAQNVGQQQPVVAQNVGQQQPVVAQNVGQQQPVVAQNVGQQGPVIAQNGRQQQSGLAHNNEQEQLLPAHKNRLQQPDQVQNNVSGLWQPAIAQNNVNGQLLQVGAQNRLAEQQMPVNSNLRQQQPPPFQAQSNNGLAEQNSVNKPVLNPNGQSASDLNPVDTYVSANQQGHSQIDTNSLPSNQQNYPVAKPIQGQQMIDDGGLYADTQNHHIIDNGGLSANQQKPASNNGNDQYVDQSLADEQPQPTNKPNSPSEFNMINKLHPAYITGNEPSVKPPGNQPKVSISSQTVRPGQMSVTPSKADSSSRTSFFITSTIRNVPKESEHSQEFGKQDDGWYYNQEIDDSLHQGVTESEKHAGKQMLMSAHHFDIPLGAFAGAKMFNNDLWLKNRKQYLMNKKSETFEPMSMALFYSWIALATLAVLAILTVFRHRHKVTGYVYDLRHWHNGGYVEEGRRLLHNAYA